MLALNALLLCATLAAGSPDSSAEFRQLCNQFQQPALRYHPETWFHFIGGNIGKEGITKDLEAIKGAGLAGIQLFNGQFGGPWPGVPQVPCLSTEWDAMIGHTAAECKRLGLKFSMEGCAGWSMAGGPWIPASRGMRHLCENRTDISAGQRISNPLPISAEATGAERDYRDICVLAFPLPAGDSGTSLKPDSVSTDATEDSGGWIKMISGKGNIELPPGKHTVTVQFNKPQVLRTLMLPAVARMTHAQEFNPLIEISVSVPGPSGTWTQRVKRAIPRANWQDSFPLSLAVPDLKSDKFRITFHLGRSIALDYLELQESARTDDWQGKAAYTLRALDDTGVYPRPKEACIAPGSVLDITSKMDARGVLNWTPTSGRWAVLRCGHYYTGAKNGPAPAEATGPEVDKMDAGAADLHFSHYIGRLSAPGGPAGSGLKGMVLDSWECISQTWTPQLEAIFKAKHGYPLRPWLPAIQGWVVESPESTERFLRDWRSTLSDQITDAFYGEMARLAKQRGITTAFETALGDVVSGDILRYMSKPDVPMCEFWYPDCPQRGGEETKPILPTASAAHIYGKKVVAAESLTSVDLHWNESFSAWKTTLDKGLALGVNQVVFHTFTHNPRTDVVPGTSFGAGIGSPFLRGQTWWPQMPFFTDYVSRCETLLQAGRPSADVLWFLGDELDHKPRQDTPFPAGYHFDYCNADVVQNRLRVSRGLLTIPEGTSWRLLWLRNTRRVTPGTLRGVLRLLQTGATVAGAPPTGCATLEPGADRICDRLIRQIWGSNPGTSGNRHVGQGRIVWYPEVAESPRKALEGMHLAPDVAFASGLKWNHRITSQADIYFVAANGSGSNGMVRFRSIGRPLLFNPVNGSMVPAPVYRQSGGNTDVWLDLPGAASVFVVLQHGALAVPHLESVRHNGHDLAAAVGTSGPTILSAHYGVEGDKTLQADVTALVKRMAASGVTSIPANNGLVGDPALRHVKTLWISIQSSKGPRTLRAGEGQSILLTQPPTELSTITVLPNGALVCWENGDLAVTPAGKRVSATRHLLGLKSLTIQGPCSVQLHGEGAPAQPIQLESIQPWSNLTDADIRWFSGEGTYHIEFEMANVDSGKEYLLDLGELSAMARVSVNGSAGQFVWATPFRFPVTGQLHRGKNTLDVRVTNTWHNRLSYDASLPEALRKTWTISGPGPQPVPDASGLTGPVRLYEGHRIGLTP